MICGKSRFRVIKGAVLCLLIGICFTRCDQGNDLQMNEIQSLKTQFTKAIDDNLPKKAEELLQKLIELGADVEKEKTRLQELKDYLAGLEASFDKAAEEMDLEASRTHLLEMERANMNTRVQVAKIQEVEAHHIMESYPSYDNLEIPAKTVEWFRQEALAGNPTAQMNLGFIYCKGIAVAQNFEEAARWLLKAAEANQPMGQVLFGQLFVAGQGVPLSPDVGAKWIEKAAKQGFVIGEFILAIYYRDGTGVPKSLENAKKWMKRAAAQNDKRAIEELEELEKLDQTQTSDSQSVEAGANAESASPKKPLQINAEDAHERVYQTGAGIEFPMIKIQKGSFVMGSPLAEESRNPFQEYSHEVTISKPFRMGKTEVTQEQWTAITGTNPSTFKDPQRPVENVSWEDIQEFLILLNKEMDGQATFRLPTESEWEYACRAGSEGPFSGDLNDMAWFGDNAENGTQPTGLKTPNTWGLYDMHGNVSEWVEDAWSIYPEEPTVDPVNKGKGDKHIHRGGSWQSYAKHLRSANRGINNPDFRANTLGFRLACAIN